MSYPVASAPFDSSVETTFTTMPHPKWTYGQKTENLGKDGVEWAKGEEAGWKLVDTSKTEPAELYALMISGIVPRPVAFVSSVSESGVDNLAPFSWFNMVSHYPPVVSICFTNLANSLKDSASNIKATKGFVVNIMSTPFIEQANATSMDCPPDVSEWELSGLTKAPSVHVKAPRVLESAFSMECELFEVIDIKHPETGVATTTMILGHVKYIHVRHDVLNDRGRVDPVKYKPIARLGDVAYATLGTAFRIARPQWKAEEEKIKELSGSKM
ncbi:hypothetical protein EIP86_000233 [Pleurotus ostreatoroseus]|nr:hypothetical protein EIP86_000233 [Pleurotus ostreatoroseus]